MPKAQAVARNGDRSPYISGDVGNSVKPVSEPVEKRDYITRHTLTLPKNSIRERLKKK